MYGISNNKYICVYIIYILYIVKVKQIQPGSKQSVYEGTRQGSTNESKKNPNFDLSCIENFILDYIILHIKGRNVRHN